MAEISPKWLNRYFSLAEEVASWSEDESTKVGCVIVGDNKEIKSLGYNGLPRGVEHKAERLERPNKYMFTEHAERNAIYNATLNGISLSGSTIVVTHFPCADCARAIIQSGIKHVWFRHSTGLHWNESEQASSDMFLDAKVSFKSLVAKKDN